MHAFSSLEFWVFSLLFVITFRSLSKSRIWAEFFLLFINLLFLYLIMNFKIKSTIAYIALSIFLWAITYLTLLIPQKKIKAFFLGFSIILIAGFLSIEKYNLTNNVGSFGFVGISYFSFKMISYVYEAYLGLISNKSLVRFFNFTFFFPAVLSGPIDRYNRFNKNMDIIRQDQIFPTFLECSDLLYRIALGAFKTFAISSLIFEYFLSDIDSGGANLVSVFDIIKAAYAYTFYLYFNFSGYSDMAIGLANLVGIHLPENFNKPFSATSIQEFWNRWHITLSQWIRDFIFTPLAKFLMKYLPNCNPIFLTSFSIFVSFMICGIWHGLGLNFLIWGALQGLGLAIHFSYKNFMTINFREFYKSIKKNNIYIFASWILTFHFSVFSILIFSLKDLHLENIITQLGDWLKL